VEAQPMVEEDEITQHIPLDDIREMLVEHMPASERLQLMATRLSRDTEFEQRTKEVRSDITSLGFGQA